jgi:chromosome partitioning protein
MGKVISVGLQKGGVGKTTTTAILAYLLSKEFKVLAIDFDSQGNLTSILSQKSIYNYSKSTVFEACVNRNPKPHIKKLTENLHILPADDMLATFSNWLIQKKFIDNSRILRDTIEVIKNDYDFILIDLPPNLGEQTINGLCASDYAIAMLQSEPFSYDALDKYIGTLSHIQEHKNPNLILCGILPTLLDSRTIIDTAIINKARQEYEDVVFKTTIRRKNRLKEFSITGIQDTSKSDIMALEAYYSFVEELKLRVI